MIENEIRKEKENGKGKERKYRKGNSKGKETK